MGSLAQVLSNGQCIGSVLVVTHLFRNRPLAPLQKLVNISYGNDWRVDFVY